MTGRYTVEKKLAGSGNTYSRIGSFDRSVEIAQATDQSPAKVRNLMEDMSPGQWYKLDNIRIYKSYN